MKFFFAFLALALAAPIENAHAGKAGAVPHVRAALHPFAPPDAATDAPATRWYAVVFRLDPHWHVYWKNPGDSGEAIRLKWQLPNGWREDALRWPTPARIETAAGVNFGYAGAVALFAPFRGEGTGKLAGVAKWLVCDDMCVPESQPLEETALPEDQRALVEAQWKRVPQTDAHLTATLGTGKDGPTLLLGGLPFPEETPVFFPEKNSGVRTSTPAVKRDARGLELAFTASSVPAAGPTFDGVLQFTGAAVAYEVHAPLATPAASPEAPKGAADWIPALWLALLGGLILNLMPCVFPVLAIKILGFVEQSRASRAQLVRHGAAYALGILVSFWSMAGLLFFLRAAGQHLGWGFQLQSPLMIASLCFLFTAMAMNLLGAFEILLPGQNLGQGLASKSGFAGSFFSGVLAAVVASPCTAPFMGSAIGIALTQPPIVGLSIFTALGLGLALPYFVLSLYPKALHVLPRPGAWMNTLKEALSFPLFATVAWLLWVLSAQIAPTLQLEVTIAVVFFAFCLWALARAPKPALRFALGLLLLASIAVPLRAVAKHERKEHASVAEAGWKPFTVAAVRAERDRGRAVFVNFTAAWCVTCKANEPVLESESVQKKFREKNVELFVADWTNPNEEIEKTLESFGRNGIPVYALYAPGAEAVLLPQLLTPAIVIEALDRLPAR